MILHIVYLHVNGGNNRFNLFIKYDKVRFFPYYFAKDLYYTNYIILVYLTLIGFAPNYLLHVDNYVEADPLVTPPHIVPEWYFLIFYAMLRSVPSKVGGILVLLFSILLLFILPYLRRTMTFTQEPNFNWSTRKFLFLRGLNDYYVEALILDLQKLAF